MKLFFTISTLLIVVLVYGLSFLEVSDIDDLALDKNSTIVAGEGDVCRTPYSEVDCDVGLECISVSLDDDENQARCFPPDFTREELEEKLLKERLEKEKK